MRAALLFGVIALCLVGRVGADPVTTDATVMVAEVEVRSGPSPQFYATSKLRQGQPVRVLRVENGWLAIEPPKPESFSWVNSRHVEVHGNTADVNAPVTELRVGSAIVDAPPSVTQAQVKRGAQLIVIGKAKVGDDGSWLPVVPHVSEVRYIPADAIKTTPAAPAAPNVPQPPAANALWLQAVRAEGEGNTAEATRLYSEVYKAAYATDNKLAAECWRRLQWLTESPRTPAPAANPAAAPNENIYGRVSPAPVGFTGQPPTSPQQGRTTSQYTYVPEKSQTRLTNVQATPPVQPNPAATAGYSAPASSAATLQWVGPGRLYRAPFSIDGKQAYGLEPNVPGYQRLYVTSPAGLNLETFVNRNVQLYGALSYHGELRTYHMTATHANVLP